MKPLVMEFGRYTFDVLVSHVINNYACIFDLGAGDCVECFFCGVQIYAWEKGDIPVDEHAHWKPDCKYVQRLQNQEKECINCIEDDTEKVLARY